MAHELRLLCPYRSAFLRRIKAVASAKAHPTICGRRCGCRTGCHAEKHGGTHLASSENNVPPYVVFADKVLMAIAARKKPTNEFDLLDIPGIGPAKAAKFGEAVLDLVRKHLGPQ